MESLSAAEVLKDLKEQERDLVKTQAADMLIAVGSMNDFAMRIKDALKSMKGFAKVLIAVYGTYKSIQIINGVIATYKAAQAWSEGVSANAARMSNLESKKSLVPLASRLSLMVAQAAAWVVMNPIKSLIGLGLAAGAGAIIYSQMKDGVIGPGGETVVSGPKGSIQLDKDDSLIAGTNLGGKGKGEKGERGGGARRDAALISKVEQLIAINQQILAKSPVIEMGGNEVGQGINTAEREIQ